MKNSIVYDTKLREVNNRNSIASKFIQDNYEGIVKVVVKKGISLENAYDLVNDVYVSVLNDEKNGEGYSPNKGKYIENITVEQFIFSRVKLYAKNRKYWVTNGAEIPSTPDGEDIEDMSDSQKAMAMAAGYNDEIMMVIAGESIKEQMEYFTVCMKEKGIDARYLLKNLHILMDKTLDRSVFNKLRQFISESDELRETFIDIVTYYTNCPDKYEKVVAAI